MQVITAYKVFFTSLLSAVLGPIFALVPSVFFSVVSVFITLYKLPVNIWKTYEITINTYFIKWDVKVAILILLPVAHLLFLTCLLTLGPIICFIWTSCFFINDFYSALRGYETNELKKYLQNFKDGVKEYWKANNDLVTHLEKTCTKIPKNWDGKRWSLPCPNVLHIVQFLFSGITGMIACFIECFLGSLKFLK